MPASPSVTTHSNKTFNQSSAFHSRNLYASDPFLMSIGHSLGQSVHEASSEHGAIWGSVDALQLAGYANEGRPQLVSHDRYGVRVERVDYHPSYHALMRRSLSQGLHSSVWEAKVEEGSKPHLERAIKLYMTAQTESGHLASIMSSHAAVGLLRHAPELLQDWVPGLRARVYDASESVASQKNGLLLSFALTEKQAGSAQAEITTRAEQLDGTIWRVVGQKWVVAAPTVDGLIVSAQTENGISLFLVPRILPDGTLNATEIQRLKPLQGNQSGAFAEIDFKGAFCFLIGKEAEGASLLQEVQTSLRLDNALLCAGLARSAVAQAVHYARGRNIGGTFLCDQPLMQRVLADMALDVVGITALCLRLARSFDEGRNDPYQAAFIQVVAPIANYLISKISPALITEAMECFGVNGLSEDWPVARLLPDCLGSVGWTSPGNVSALDVVSILKTHPALVESVLSSCASQLGADYSSRVDAVRAHAIASVNDLGSTRIFCEKLGALVIAAELKRLTRASLFNAYVETRLNGAWRVGYGHLAGHIDSKDIIDTIFPDVGRA